MTDMTLPTRALVMIVIDEDTISRNTAGVAAIGAIDFAVTSLHSSRAGFLVALAASAALILICIAFLTWMRRANG